MGSDEARTCPDCGSNSVILTQRGFAGPTDESDQYFRCDECGRVTFEIVARSDREMKVEKIERGKVLRAGGHNYLVMRVLRAGLNEFLIYLRPEESHRSNVPRNHSHR